ncbi:MAG: ANTAR domain-containing protein [Clostridiales bacterium]|jgi:response regulator NasT|nr:ANTAR domain-containing protein [Eubacteriales bacterium]MDH7567206.1 ANTAR domain-containing protein [Clostridiales bacterium]
MEYGKFILCGEDKKTLGRIKNTLASNGHIYVGYTKQVFGLLRHIRNCTPDLVIIDVSNCFKDYKPTLEVIDEEILAGCILIMDSKSEEVFNFIHGSRIMSYLTKPVYDEIILQIVDISLMNYKRIHEYERKVKKLNETLESRKVVEKAKWILVEKEGYSEAEAYEIIKKKSRDNRIPMREIAEALILTRG